MTLNTLTAATFPVRNDAPLRDRQGQLRRVMPNVAGVNVQQPPLNEQEHAMFKWALAQRQAVTLPDEVAALTQEFQQVEKPLLERQAALLEQRAEVRERLSQPLTLTEQEVQQLQARQDELQAAETALPAAEQSSTEALAAAGMVSREELHLNPDAKLHLGSEGGAYAPYTTAKVWGWAVMLPGVLMAPALWDAGLRSTWMALGLDSQWDVAGVAFAALVGIAVAHTLKGVLEGRAASAARHDMAQRGALPGEEYHAHLQRWQWASNLTVAVLILLFAFIEANLIQASLGATDPQARLSGNAHWLTLIGALVALTPALLYGVNVGRQRGWDTAASELRARSREQALRSQRAQPAVQEAIRQVGALDNALVQWERSKVNLAQARASMAERHAQEQASTQAMLNFIEGDLTTVQRDLDVHRADYGRRLEQLYQRADQRTEIALLAFQKTSRRPGLLERLWQALRPGQREVLV